jgi:hypothetical protein
MPFDPLALDLVLKANHIAADEHDKRGEHLGVALNIHDLALVPAVDQRSRECSGAPKPGLRPVQGRGERMPPWGATCMGRSSSSGARVRSWPDRCASFLRL